MAQPHTSAQPSARILLRGGLLQDMNLAPEQCSRSCCLPALCVQAPSCGLTLFLLRGHCGLRFCTWCMVACASPPDERGNPGCCRPLLWPRTACPCTVRGGHGGSCRGRAPEARAAGCTGWGSALAVHSSPTPSPSMRTHGCVGSSPVPSGLRPLLSEILVC